MYVNAKSVLKVFPFEFPSDLETQKLVFQAQNTEFEANLQVLLDNTKNENEKENRDIQLFAQEVLRYKEIVLKEIQKFQYEEIGKTTKKYEWLASRYSALLNEYNSAYSLMGDVASRSKAASPPAQGRKQ